MGALLSEWLGVRMGAALAAEHLSACVPAPGVVQSCSAIGRTDRARRPLPWLPCFRLVRAASGTGAVCRAAQNPAVFYSCRSRPGLLADRAASRPPAAGGGPKRCGQVSLVVILILIWFGTLSLATLALAGVSSAQPEPWLTSVANAGALVPSLVGQPCAGRRRTAASSSRGPRPFAAGPAVGGALIGWLGASPRFRGCHRVVPPWRSSLLAGVREPSRPQEATPAAPLRDVREGGGVRVLPPSAAADVS